MLSLLGAISCGRILPGENPNGHDTDNLNNRVQCGPNLCGVAQVCCNPSCGICTPSGQACTQQACAPTTGACYRGGCSGELCSDQPGAISTCIWREEFACYQDATCERQSNGDCGFTQTPELIACLGPTTSTDAGPHCSGVVCAIYCAYGHQRDANGCEICACNPAPDAGLSTSCGPNTCGANEECCNPSCGFCVPKGGACSKQACAGPDAGPRCPPLNCPQVCAWGYQIGADGCLGCACNPAPADAGLGTQCGPNVCNASQECCNASCGTCVPKGGFCTQQVCQPVCPAIVCTNSCPYGHQTDPSGCEICACNPPPPGPSCGPTTCAVGLVCCNASCGFCVPPGDACTQQACQLSDAGS